MKVKSVSKADDGTQIIRLTNGQLIELTELDVRLFELVFYTHCPGCQHERGLVE